MPLNIHCGHTSLALPSLARCPRIYAYAPLSHNAPPFPLTTITCNCSPLPLRRLRWPFGDGRLKAVALWLAMMPTPSGHTVYNAGLNDEQISVPAGVCLAVQKFISHQTHDGDVLFVWTTRICFLKSTCGLSRPLSRDAQWRSHSSLQWCGLGRGSRRSQSFGQESVPSPYEVGRHG